MKTWTYRGIIAGLPLELRWGENGRVRMTGVRLGVDVTAPGVPVPLLPAAARRQMDALTAMLGGGNAAVALEDCDLDGLTPFQRLVLTTLHREVPRGRLTTYGGLARLAAVPRACRAVGGALHINPLPLVIPCHRVVAGDCSPGGFGCGVEWKLKLLAGEGLRPERNGRYPASVLLGADHA